MMSEDFFSEFTMSDWDMSQMEQMSCVQVSVVDGMPNDQQFGNAHGTNQKTSVLGQTFGNPLLNPIRSLHGGFGDADRSSIGSSSDWVSIQPSIQGTIMMNKATVEKTLLPVKRKAGVGNISDNSFSQVHNKHPSHMGSYMRKPGPVLSNPDSRGLLVQSINAKKMVRSDSSMGKYGLQRGHPVKKQTTQIGSAPKNSRDSSEAVRSKMRESLASALDLVVSKTDDGLNNEKRSPDMGASQQPTPESNLQTGGRVSGSESADMLQNQEFDASVFVKDSQEFPSEPDNPVNEINGNEEHPFQDFDYLPDVDVSFRDSLSVKDDLLQGNGLSWALDFDMQMREAKDAQNSGNILASESMKKEGDEKPNSQVVALTSEELAFKIEAELFKLHGGVNKKYKEKGRSLLFNLKDPNNPELRERVVSGEIPPERLCAMSAEELASKELSEWRTAKAEEMAQMVVLPDTEIDMRRLVRKTHKGEYQVEFDRDESIVADVSAGTSMVTQLARKPKSEAPSPPKESDAVTENTSVQETSSENNEDGTDLMQGMTGNELKDAANPPPIVSLDEFMESLKTERSFEDVSSDAEQGTPSTKAETSKVQSRSTDRSFNSAKYASTKSILKKHSADMATKVSGVHVKHKVPISSGSKVDYIWEGNLQLNVSHSVCVGGLLLSGEKTSTREWPSSLEIKGRVRLEAFEKFLRELHMSRSRAVMVLQFVLKDKSSEIERSNLSEAIESYSSDERLGYAEPSSGVELYLCPPTTRIIEILNKNVAKERLDIEGGLIGAIVWRRAHVSSKMVSPPNYSSSSHHKHAFKRQQQQLIPSQYAVKNSPHVNVPTAHNRSAHEEEEDDDDVPPGFGPQPAKEDDDLPEFSFSRTDVDQSSLLSKGPSQSSLHLGSKKMTDERSLDHVRELIQKYGKSSGDDFASGGTWADSRGGIGRWNDDDDDIPEWRPQQAQNRGPPGLGGGLAPNQYAG